MTESEAIEVLTDRHTSIGTTKCDDVAWRKLKPAIDTAVNALEEIQQYRAIGTVEECREARKKQGVCEPEYLGENVAIGCRDGKCDCGNIVRSYQNFCDDCGIKLEWDCVRG